MNIVVTGANGFVGKNLIQALGESVECEIFKVTRDTTSAELESYVAKADFIFHLAGENRPTNVEDFYKNNANFTEQLCSVAKNTNKKIPILYTSSTQSSLDNDYGKSKKQAEDLLSEYSESTGTKTYIYQLPNVFGKWSKPNYNSVVATFCYNVVNGIPLVNNAPEKVLNLVYIDDVVKEFINTLNEGVKKEAYPIYNITLQNLQEQIESFKHVRETNIIEKVGTSITRALYSTYLSFVQPKDFSYSLVKHEDPRGVFVEMLKTKESGQFSFFTAHPGITRGGHYHHSKNEKFLVIRGKARFGFRNMITNEKYELIVTSDKPVVVDTVPGWTHDITNIGDEEMIVMLWANEIFDRENPDTFTAKVD
ncbi:NAD-dependent epimerase/dehydratase family protein [Halobacteriovorax sp. RZ-3]|uniref:UDP-2-acetamido-2,6-beta-L-arabino-hexul-4-ose reductase n=1 Tax=Halobacteriovorax sp. RZ-3 TaxID=3157720 RepID=UPI003710B651